METEELMKRIIMAYLKTNNMDYSPRKVEAIYKAYQETKPGTDFKEFVRINAWRLTTWKNERR